MVGTRSALATWSCLALLAAARVEAYRDGDQICQYTADSSCPLNELAVSDVDGSALIYPGGDTRCAFDSFADATEDFAPNATYFFQVFPKTKPTDSARKLLIMLQGGGACLDATTCNFALQCSLGSPTFNVAAKAARATGVFDASDPKNVFADWDIVHIPYCTGDLHMGSGIVIEGYDTGLESFFNHPECLNLEMDMHMNGFANTKSALDWARSNYPTVDELVVSGMSAGALAAQVLSGYVADLWGVPVSAPTSSVASSPRFSVLVDSYVAVLPERNPAGKTLDFFGTCDIDDIPFPGTTRAECQAETLTTVALGTALLGQRPETYWGFVNSQGDHTQRYFYQFALDGVVGYPFANLMAPEDFYKDMMTILDSYQAISNRVLTFIVEGEQHVFLGYDEYYNIVSDAGVQLGAFLSNWLTTSLSPAQPPVSPSPTPAPSTPATDSPAPTATPTLRPGC